LHTLSKELQAINRGEESYKKTEKKKALAKISPHKLKI
jgi:hypothetical protein